MTNQKTIPVVALSKIDDCFYVEVIKNDVDVIYSRVFDDFETSQACYELICDFYEALSIQFFQEMFTTSDEEEEVA